MKSIKDLIRRLVRIDEARTVALEKRRLERLLREEGLSRSAASRVVRVYFAPHQN